MMKTTTEQIEKGKELAKKLKSSILFINEKGEYFTTENLAQLSVAGDKEKYKKLDFSTSVEVEPIEELELQEELAEISELKTIEEIQTILDIELEGAAREDIIEACENRIEELKPQE